MESAKLAGRFATSAENHHHLLDEVSTLRIADPEVQAERDAVYAALEVGEDDQARAWLDETRAIARAKRETMAHILADQQREKAALTAEQAFIERARRGHREATELYEQAAELFHPPTLGIAGTAYWKAGNALQDQGYEFGDNAVLVDTISTYE